MAFVGFGKNQSNTTQKNCVRLMENAVYMIAAARTAVAPSGGSFKHLNYDMLAAGVIQHCLKEVGLSNAQVDELDASDGEPTRRGLWSFGAACAQSIIRESSIHRERRATRNA